MNILQICPPHLSDVATLPWEIQKRTGRKKVRKGRKGERQRSKPNWEGWRRTAKLTYCMAVSSLCVRYTSIESSVGNAEYYRKYCSPQTSDYPWYFNVLRSDPLRKAIVLQKLLVQFEANFHVLNFHFRTPGHSGSIASPTGQPVHRWKNRSINASRGCRGC